MSEITHQMTVNGQLTMDLTDAFRSYRAQIGRSLSLLDGEKKFAYKIAAYPPGLKSISTPKGWRPTQYLQCAGSAEVLAIEVRIVGDDGVARQFAVGRGGGGRSSAPSVRIPYGDTNSVTVYPDEVFEQEEAGDIFYRYFQTGSVGEQYTLRELDLGAPA